MEKNMLNRTSCIHERNELMYNTDEEEEPMKLIHLSDLHLGKRLNEFSLLEDQNFILKQILQIIDEEQPDAVLIAGDVYDRSLPPEEAVRLFDEFLSGLAERRLQTLIISGNHDSAQRIAFGGRLMSPSGIHPAPVYDGKVEPVVLEDEYGPVFFYMLPFVKPAHVRRCFAMPEQPEETIETYEDAVRVAIAHMGVDPKMRNVILCHQFISGATRSESEEISIGGLDEIPAEVLEDFDYAALGHLHRPQNVGSKKIRYCGTPLKYSFSEADHDKSVTVVELGEKGSLDVRTVPLKPQRDLREIRGKYDELMFRDSYQGTPTDDYLHVTLTDEEDIPDAISRLRQVYPNIMKLDYDNTRTRNSGSADAADDVHRQSPLELIGEFYEKQNGQKMNETQQEYCRGLAEQIWEVGQ